MCQLWEVLMHYSMQIDTAIILLHNCCSFFFFQIMSNYDEDVAKKCLAYIQAITGCSEIPSDYDAIDASHDHFHELLYNGMLLCK